MNREQAFLEAQQIYEKKIADLEAKLAESERNNLILYSMLYQILEKQGCDNIPSEINQMTGLMLEKQSDWFKGNRNYDQLKQQLAEKERQVKKLNNEAQKYFEDAYCNDFHNQDKISFCIEKFQETKKSLRDKVCLMENDEHCYPQNAIHWQDVVAIIDNQINKLKGKVEDVKD